MAIARGNVATATATGTSLTYTHTVAAGSDFLVVAIDIIAVLDDITGVTYNGTAMTRAVNQATPSGITRDYIYYLIAPTTGANSVVVSATPGVQIIALSVDYSGTKQSGQPDSTATGGAASGTAAALNFTVVTANSWTVGFIRNEAAPPTASTGSTSIETSPADNGLMLADSNGALTAGAHSMNWTFANSNWNVIGISIAPVAVVATNHLLTLLGAGI